MTQTSKQPWYITSFIFKAEVMSELCTQICLKKKKDINELNYDWPVFFPSEYVDERQEKAKKKKKKAEVDKGDLQKVEHGSLLSAELHPSP